MIKKKKVFYAEKEVKFVGNNAQVTSTKQALKDSNSWTNGDDHFSIHTSDRITFKRCRRKWDFSSPLRQHLAPQGGVVTPLWFGTGFHFAKYLVNRTACERGHDAAETLQGRLFRKSAGRTKIGHGQWLFHGAAQRHDFGEQADDMVVRQWSGIQFAHSRQDLRLAFRPVCPAILDFSYLLRKGCALAYQPEQFAVDRVYLVAQWLEVGHQKGNFVLVIRPAPAGSAPSARL